jgi:hypothetical protein
MVRTLALIALLALASPIAFGAQAPGGIPRTVTVVMAGPALSGGAVQEALLIGIPWGDFGDQLFPRQNVRIRMEYFWGADKIVPIVEDVRQRGFDYERAKFLLSRSGILDRRPRFVLVGDLARPEVKRATYWLRDQLKRFDLFVEDNVREERNLTLEFLLEREKADAVLQIRGDR